MALASPTGVLTNCPYCGQPIGTTERARIQQTEGQRLDQLVAERIQTEKVRLAADANKAKDDARRAEEALAKAKTDFARLEEELDARVQKQVEIEKRQLETDLADAKEDARHAEEELERMKASHVQELESMVTELKAEHAREVERRVETERLKVEGEVFKEVHEKDKKLELANKTIENLQKQLEGKAAFELGGMQEDQLLELLRKEFPRDKITLIPKGHPGGDIKHEVCHNGETCGLILYESKNVQGWQDKFISKLHKDKAELRASHAVLVSTAFPAKEKDFCIQDDVCVVHPRLVLHPVRLLRQALIDVHMQSLSQDERGFKLEALMIFLGGPDFKNKMQNVFRAVHRLEAIQQQERTKHDKNWAEQTVLFKTITNSSSDIQSEITAILAGR